MGAASYTHDSLPVLITPCIDSSTPEVGGAGCAGWEVSTLMITRYNPTYVNPTLAPNPTQPNPTQLNLITNLR